jgi:Ser/Thr protein kinase RdoA (MazF antagonist)
MARQRKRGETTPFAELTAPAQLKRLRQLAETALHAYGLAVVRLEPMHHLFNTTFRVETGTGRYCLRIHRSAHHTAAEIRSEMIWLAAITSRTSIGVPRPIANRAGELVTTVASKGVPEPRHCALFEWVEGRFAREGLRPYHLLRVGRLMAELHEQVQTFEPPDGFSRPRLALEGEIQAMIGQAEAGGGEWATPEAVGLWRATAEALRQRVAALGYEADAFNLIHADLHQSNYLFEEGAVRAIDFDDCGWGHFAYDMAVTLWYIRRRPLYDQMREAFLYGYRQVRPLPVDHEAAIEPYLVARTLLLSAYLATEVNPAIRPLAPQLLPRMEGELRAFLDGSVAG